VPTVLRVGGFQVIVHLPPREHGPAHVHVRHQHGRVVVALDPIGVVKVDGMPARDVVRAVRIVEHHIHELLEQWRTFHGEAKTDHRG
jgi:hypothetical protein